MPVGRFLIFWLVDYLVATVVVYVLSSAGQSIFGMPSLTYGSLLFIPISTMFFSWMAYRGIKSESAHRLIVAACWVGLAAFVDVGIAFVVMHVSPIATLSSPIVIAVFGTKFLAVFVGAYLGLKSVKPLDDLSDNLLPRSSST